MYTIAPEKFVLADQRFGDPSASVRFKAAVFRGHFERQGTRIIDQVEIEIVRAVKLRPLRANETRPSSFRGFLVGVPPEQFIAHEIFGIGNFDQVVKVSGGPATEGEIEISARPDRNPLLEGETLDVRLLSNGQTLPMRVERELYNDSRDLAQ
jgi:hypothetical protein